MGRKTVKDLNNDFEVLKESFEILKSDFERKFDDLKIDYESKIKSIQDQISTPETNDEPSMRETSNNIAFKCRECSFSSGKRSDLKLHILALHPKQYECRLCSNIFDSRLAFELHQKSHNEEKNFKCEVCGQAFYTKWRLGMHQRQHELTDVRFCHFFNNSKFCKFEDLGCMFKHEEAPICQKATFCRVIMCQFKHSVFVEKYTENLILERKCVVPLQHL